MNMKILAVSTLIAVFITGVQSAEGFLSWIDIMKSADVDKDAKITPAEIVNFTHESEYPGFQPYMASHFPLFDFNGDGALSMDECRDGMKKLGLSDEQVTTEFKRDFYNLRDRK